MIQPHMNRWRRSVFGKKCWRLYVLSRRIGNGSALRWGLSNFFLLLQTIYLNIDSFLTALSTIIVFILATFLCAAWLKNFEKEWKQGRVMQDNKFILFWKEGINLWTIQSGKKMGKLN